jgi:hypothetical protein
MPRTLPVARGRDQLRLARTGARADSKLPAESAVRPVVQGDGTERRDLGGATTGSGGEAGGRLAEDVTVRTVVAGASCSGDAASRVRASAVLQTMQRPLCRLFTVWQFEHFQISAI